MFNQSQVCWVNLDPTVGAEIKKTRPCVVLSPNEMNEHLSTIIIAPITSRSRLAYPTRLHVKCADINGDIVLDQIRTVDKARLFNAVGSLDNKTITKLKMIIKEMLVD